MQILTIAGNVGKDAELRRTQSGDPVLGFTVAVDNGKDRDGNKRDATWFDCSLWGKRAESLQNHITKGSKLSLSGRPTCREYNGKAYLGLSVDQLTFMGGGQSQDRNGGSYDQSPEKKSDGYGGGGRPSHDIDDDVPFACEWRT